MSATISSPHCATSPATGCTASSTLAAWRGLTCVIFVLLFIRDELSYDKWIPVPRTSIGLRR